MSITFCIKVKNDQDIKFEMPVSLFFYKALLEYKKREPLLQNAFPVHCLGEFSEVSLDLLKKGLGYLIEMLTAPNSKALVVYSFKSTSDVFGCFNSCSAKIEGKTVIIEGGIGTCEIRSYKLDLQGKPIAIDRIIDISGSKELITDDMTIQIVRKKKKIKELPDLIKMQDFISSLAPDSMLCFCINTD